ncbi:MAG: O-antigen ligase family protein [Solirubrobacterales bacterium]
MSDLLAGAGVVVAAASAAAAILLPAGRARSATMLTALVLSPVLIAGDQWHSPEITDLRDDPTRLIALGLAAIAVVTALALAFRRWPIALPLAIVATLPFRIPLEAGGDTANLLVPLYLVIGGGVLANALREWRGVSQRSSTGGVGEGSSPAAREDDETSPATGPVGRSPLTWLPRILAAVVVLYALQTLYSPDFSKSLQSVCFFFVPFSLVYVLLRDVKWDRRLLTLALVVVAVEAVAFVVVGSIEYVTRSLFWNDQVIRSNEFHTYFRVNSVFWDPNIYGRYLALAIVIAMAALLWARERRTLAILSALVVVLWIGLVPTFSQSSFAALLAGLAVLAALRWSLRWTLTLGAGAVIAALFLALASGSIDFSKFNADTSGRANLASGGVDLFAQRPLWGYGAGSFPTAYREHVATKKAPVSVSHTEPVTVAAEQGLIGLVAYTALLVTALLTMASKLRSPPTGPVAEDVSSSSRAAGDDPSSTPPVGRAAVLAAFVALLVHTMAYAGFYEDPITWTLLAVGASLAAMPTVRDGT